MRSEIEKLGGVLHFSVTKESDGWFAECVEFPAILTGDTGKNPSDKEIAERIFDVLRTVFDLAVVETQDEPLIKAGKNEKELSVSYS